MARRALRGVEDVTKAALQISRGALGQRLPEKNRGKEISDMARMFNHMLDQIQRVIKEMGEMNDTIAHDLRSPITRIRGAAEITLATGKATRSVVKYEKMAASIIEECDYLLEIINTTLEISETKAGVSESDFQKIDMSNLVQDICDLFGPLTEDSGRSLTVTIPETLYLFGDRKQLQRLMVNLLDNALKYTPSPGTITVSLIKTRRGSILLSVNDTGVGIAPEDLPFIFDRFYRCDKSRSKSGSGLGLCLAKAIVEAHKGTIKVISRPDQGSQFLVKIPRYSEGQDQIEITC